MTYEGNCRLGDLFESRREKGRPGLPLLSVTMTDGLVDRDDLDRKQDTALTPEEHLLVQPGDIAYNMMRMWQGAFGLASKVGLVSPAYVVLKPKPRLDPLYGFYLLKSPRMRYLLWAFSYGITDDRLRLYFDDFSQIPAHVPPFNIQKQIGEMLSAWDKAITCSCRLEAFERERLDDVARQYLTGAAMPIGRRTKNHKVTLTDCAEVIVSSVDKRVVPGEKPVALCNYTDVYYNRHLKRDHQFEEGTATQSEIDRFSLRANDVVVTKDSEIPSDIGVASCVVDPPENLVCGYHLAIVRPKEAKVDGVVLQAAFSLQSIRKHLFSHANGVTRFGLPLRALETIELQLPSIDEQKTLRCALLASQRQYELRRSATALLRREKAALEQRLLAQRPRVEDRVAIAASALDAHGS